jgi:hypothetical protein
MFEKETKNRSSSNTSLRNTRRWSISYSTKSNRRKNSTSFKKTYSKNKKIGISTK